MIVSGKFLVTLFSDTQLLENYPDVYGVRRSSRSRKEPERYTVEVSLIPNSLRNCITIHMMIGCRLRCK